MHFSRLTISRIGLLRHLCISALALYSSQLSAENEVEQQLKSRYLANMASFVSWTARQQEILLCIQSSSEIAQYAQDLEGFELGQGRRLTLKMDVESLEDCEILYWDMASGDESFGRLAETAHPRLLIVSDLQSKEKLQAAVHLFVQDSKLRFAINEDQLTGKEYKISSRLMRLSRQSD